VQVQVPTRAGHAGALDGGCRLPWSREHGVPLRWTRARQLAMLAITPSHPAPRFPVGPARFSARWWRSEGRKWSQVCV